MLLSLHTLAHDGGDAAGWKSKCSNSFKHLKSANFNNYQRCVMKHRTTNN